MKKNLFFNALLIIIASCCFYLNSYSQSWVWAKDAQGNLLQYAPSITTDAWGNVYVTGQFQSATITFGSIVLTNSGGVTDFYLVKYDAAGNVLWAKNAGGYLYNQGVCVTTDAAGNVYVTGAFQSPTITFGSFTLTNAAAGTNDIFLVKYDAAGNVLMAKSAGGTSDDVGQGISIDAVGNIYITGNFRSSSISFGATTFGSAGLYDVFIVKYDVAGNALWAKNAGGSAIDLGKSIGTDAAGNSYITGYFQSANIVFGSFTLTNAAAGSNDIFLVKYDASGNVLWAKSAGGVSGDQANGLSLDVSGNIYVAGNYSSSTITFGSNTLTNAGSADVFFVKYNASGNVLWAKSAGGTASDNGYSVSADALGDVYLVGGFNSPSITFGTTTLSFPAGGDYPFYIVKYDINGNVLCASALASGGLNPRGVSSDANGNALVCGVFSTNPFSIGSTTFSLTGTQNVFVAKYICDILQVDTSHTNILCRGQCTGTATAIPTGGTSPYTYSWNSIPVQTTATASGLCAGTYTVTVTDAANTSDTASVTIIQPATTLTTSVTNTSEHCYGGSNASATVTATGGTSGYTYVWMPSGQTVAIATGLSALTYTVTVTDANGCVSQKNITVTQPPEIIITTDSTQTACNGVTGTATATPTDSTISYTYLWNDGQTTKTASGLAVGNYTVTVTDTGGCTETKMISITSTVVPTATANVSPLTIIQGDNAQLFATGGDTYDWSPAINLSCINCKSSIATPTETTTYCVTVMDTTSGCIDSTCITVHVDLECGHVYVPNAFTPDNNNSNDVFKPKASCVHNYTFLIFDRWGEKLFESNTISDGWNGYYHGKICEQDVYVYKITFIDDIKNENHQYIGRVTLVR